MPIELPTFKDTFCRMVGVALDLPSELNLAALPDGLDLTATYKVGEEVSFIHLMWDPESRHLHLDAAQRSAFGKSQPKVSAKLPAFQKSFKLFEGLMGEAFVHALQIIPVKSLPASGSLIFAGNSALRFEAGRTEIALTGATLDFKNAPVDRIKWRLGKDDVVLIVEAVRNAKVTASSLVDALKAVDSAVATFILRKSHETKKS